MRGLYLHRDSALHRLPAGRKLLLLPLAGSLLFLVPSTALSAAALAGALAGFAAARLGWRKGLSELRPALWVLLLIFAAQGWFAGIEAATLSVVRLAALLLLAALVTLTTRPSEIVAALERALQPFARLGVDPAAVALAISLMLRFVPLVAAVVAEVREAQAARGLDHSIVRLAVPVIVRLLKTSDEIAEAIDARS